MKPIVNIFNSALTEQQTLIAWSWGFDPALKTWKASRCNDQSNTYSATKCTKKDAVISKQSKQS